jgi:hypothetical protein
MQKEERSKGKKSLSQRLAIFYLMPMVSTLQFNVYERKINIAESFSQCLAMFLLHVTALLFNGNGRRIKNSKFLNNA